MTKLNFSTQNSYEMVNLNNICYLKSEETDNTTYILRMFILTPTNGTLERVRGYFTVMRYAHYLRTYLLTNGSISSYVLYSMPAAGRLTTQLAYRQYYSIVG